MLALGYHVVENHGGPYEHGRDIICHKLDEFGERTTTVIQVKRLTNSAAARSGSDDPTFSELVTQLSQAGEKVVPTLEGVATPSQVILITPYPVDARSLQSRFEAYSALRTRNLRIIDGAKLASLVSQHLPHVVLRFGAGTDMISQLMVPQLNNLPLMQALGSNTRKEIEHFYTDIDFTVGRWTTRLFLSSSFMPTKPFKLDLDQRQFDELCQLDAICRTKLSSPFIMEPREVITSLAISELQQRRRYKHVADELSQLMTQIAELDATFSSLLADIFTAHHEKHLERMKAEADLNDAREVLAEARQSLSHACVASALERELADEEHAVQLCEAECARLRLTFEYLPSDFRVIENILSRPDSPFSGTSPWRFDEDEQPTPTEFENVWHRWMGICSSAEKDLEATSGTVSSLLTLIVKTRIRIIEIESLGLGVSVDIGEIIYRPTVNVCSLCHELNRQRQLIASMVDEFNTTCPTTERLRRFLEQCQHLFEVTNQVLDHEVLANAVGIPDRMKVALPSSDTLRLRISVQQVFDTDVNLVVLGDAGAGKTTALQMYARRLLSERASECTCLFVSLARMVNGMQTIGARSGTMHDLEQGVVIAFQLLGAQIDVKSLRRILEQRKVVLILDGIDEVIGTAPWILSAIRVFATRYPMVQVVTSSRMMGDYVNRIPFLGVTLRDFTNEQQTQFFRRWFGDEVGVRRGDRIIEHLGKNREIRDVVRNPLMATVMCEVAERDGDLPRTEVRLFEDRLELLTGRLDQFRDVRRVRARRDDLLKVARKIAYWLQQSGKLEEDREVLYDVADERASSPEEAACVRAIVNELVHPCEVLVVMSPDGKIGFGHRRYQEHLAAYELARQQWPTIVPLVCLEWWRSVFVYYSMMEDTIEGFVSFVARVDPKAATSLTMRKMIEARPDNEHVKLKEILRRRGGRGLEPEVIDHLVRFSEHFNDEFDDEQFHLHE